MTYPVLMILAQGRDWDGHMMWGWGWMWVFGLLFVVLVAAAIVAALWLVAKGSDRRLDDPTARPRQILNERYARGELSTEEYRERLDTLR